MELDKRIESIKSIRSFNTDNSDCSGKFGYFTNYVDNFDNLDDVCNGTCIFEEEENFPFYAVNTDSLENRKFQFFIPEEDLLSKPKEKKFRPYTLEEFCNKGFETVVFKDKNDDSLEYHVRYNGYIKYDNDVYLIIFGNTLYPLNELFENYEYLDDDGEWKPFGVEE